MSGHTMTVEWKASVSHAPTYTFTCHEPPEALCRARWGCGCEQYAECGVDERGPWHRVHEDYIGSMTSTAIRHYGTPGGECGQLVFITESGEAEYMGHGAIRVPIDLEWNPDDETYLWKVARVFNGGES